MTDDEIVMLREYERFVCMAENAIKVYWGGGSINKLANELYMALELYEIARKNEEQRK
jgi:hypothetical protein